ncbi:MAG: GNAT family N-acetyltransferase [Armatimonadetes bacterium]|nr:GNAT family N-acetyltransferase [Armatimonadota bacterium]
MNASPFQIYDAARKEESEQWISRWDAWPGREVFAHPHYARLYNDEKSRALCAAWTSGEGSVLYPFMVRDLTQEPYWPGDSPPASDIVTPYGYGGPFFWGEGDREAVAQEFWKAFSSWAEERRVVSEFVRFSLFEETLLPYPGEREEKLQNVVRLLDREPEELWMDFEHKVRKNVKKARRSGVEIERDSTGQRLDAFMEIYNHTMDRRDASKGYYFPRSYFERIQRDLPGQFMYFHAWHEGRLVSTELVLVSTENVYSFLGGTVSEAFDLRPNDLLKYEVILWARDAGKKRFVLGGGYEPGDGIFRYKLAFAPESVYPYFVGRRILEPRLYQTLVDTKKERMRSENREWHAPPGFFPAYRS